MYRRVLKRLREDLLDFIAPSLCPGCDDHLENPYQGYCPACRASLVPAPFPRDIYGELLAALPPDEFALDAVGSLYMFEREGPVQRLIHAVKYQGCYRLGIELGSELARAISMFTEFDDLDMVAAVPLHRARERERGYNQAAAIADGIAASGSLEVASKALKRIRHTPSQTTLNAGRRHANVQRAFGMGSGSVEGRAVLVCDDVLTTGATLNACALVLKEAGARRVCAVTVARDALTG